LAIFKRYAHNKDLKVKLENVVPWGRNLEEYKKMFLLSQKDLQSKKILGCGDGPSSFNFEVTQLQGDITSIDPIYQFTKDEIQSRIDETSSVVSKQLKQNKNDFVWKNIKSVDELINIRLTAMSNFINDYENGKNEKRYIHQEYNVPISQDHLNKHSYFIPYATLGNSEFSDTKQLMNLS